MISSVFLFISDMLEIVLEEADMGFYMKKEEKVMLALTIPP